jgi:hypothetical protein
MMTLLIESSLSRKNGEAGMIQYRNIALAIVVFGPQHSMRGESSQIE